ncbi:MAG: hypothetical protein HY567_02895 [Candidatus Kerfeldbacteria bacterium]|nr:hypothetical protein [Candidatus Kerfeldbacteria bacterium]
MYLIIRLIPVILLIVMVAGFWYALGHGQNFVSMVSLVALLESVGMILLLRRSSPDERLTLLTPPVVLTVGAGAMLFFLSPWWIRAFVVGVAGLSVWIYAEEVYRYSYDPITYQPHALEHLAGYLNILSLAGGMAAIFALRIFLDVRLMVLLPAAFAFAIMVSASAFAVHPLSRQSLWSTVAVCGVLLTELTWAAHYLPATYWVDSLLVTIPFYVVLHLVRHELNRTLNRQIIRRYATVGALALAAVVVTAQWII